MLGGICVMKKIYNKKGFKSGVFLLLISLVSTVLFLKNLSEMNTLKLVKELILMIVTYFIGATSLIRSLNEKYSKEDEIEENDERNKFNTLKSESKAFRISFNACIIFNILFVVLYIMTRIEGLLYAFIGLGLLSTFMLITIIVLSIYYNQKN